MKSDKITAATTDAKFVARDTEIYKVEEAYADYERTIDSDCNQDLYYSLGYHSVKVCGDKIGHDPYVLIAMCSAVKPDFKLKDKEIQDLLNKLQQPRRQYTIKKTYKPAYPDDCDKPADKLAPDRLDITIELVNYGLNKVIDSVLNREQLAAYAGYIRSLGGRLDLFPDAPSIKECKDKPKYIDYKIPQETLNKYPALKKEMEIIQPLLGYPYVWSGSNPQTSFDCSGLISYMLDQLGYKFRNNINGKERRLPVSGKTIAGIKYDGLYEKCQPIKKGDEQPGDLVFFTKTYVTSDRTNDLSHIGVYCGNNMFVACQGDIIGVDFRKLDDPESDYNWADYLYGFGRIVK